MNTDVKRCSFVKPDGSTCGAFAVKGSDLCYNHNPSLAEARAASRRAGGRNRHRKFNWHPDTFQTLVCFHAADDAVPVMVIPLLDAFLKVRDGRMDTRTANTLAYLATSMAQNWVHGHHPDSYVPLPGTTHGRQWDAIIREVFHTDPVTFRKLLVEKFHEDPSIVPKPQPQSPPAPSPQAVPVPPRPAPPASPSPSPAPAPAPLASQSASPAPAPPSPSSAPAPPPQAASPPVQTFDLLGMPIRLPRKKDPPAPLLPGQQRDLLGNPIPLSPPKKDPRPAPLPGQPIDLLGMPIVSRRKDR